MCLHLGKLLQPKNSLPRFAPFLATRFTIGEAHFGHVVVFFGLTIGSSMGLTLVCEGLVVCTSAINSYGLPFRHSGVLLGRNP
tara:strand:+ start:92893 stop:93141 length:249 start_codon:yes stop_codon:yes gene_type:complete